MFNSHYRLLTGKKIKSVDDAWQVVEHFHKKGCHTVVLSSTDLGNDENLLALASSRTGKYYIFCITESLSLCYLSHKSGLKRGQKANLKVGFYIYGSWENENNWFSWDYSLLGWDVTSKTWKMEAAQTSENSHCLHDCMVSYARFLSYRWHKSWHWILRIARQCICIFQYMFYSKWIWKPRKYVNYTSRFHFHPCFSQECLQPLQSGNPPLQQQSLCTVYACGYENTKWM